MVRAVEQRGLHAHQGVAGEHAELHGVLDSGVHRGDVLARDATAGDGVLELVDLAVRGVQGLEGELDLRELAGAARLLLVRVVDLVDLALDGLTVGHLGLAHVGLDAELAAHAVDEHIEVQLAHAADLGLTGLLVEVDPERRVLGDELLDGGGELLLVALGLRLDGHGDHGLREGHRLEDDRLVRVAQRVTRGGVLEADHGVDVARHDLLDRVLLVGVHLEELADPLLLALGGVEDLRAGLEAAGVHADEGQRAEERVRGDLEGQRGERGLLRGLALQLLLLVAHGVALDGAGVERVREVGHDGVEHGLHAAVLERGAAEHRVGLGVHRQVAHPGGDLLLGELLALEVLLHELLGGVCDGLDELGAVLLGLLSELRRDVLDLVLGAHGHVALGVARPHEGLHGQQVDDADEVVLGADRQLHHEGLGAETLHDRVHGEVEVRAELVHLVDEADTGDVVLVRLAPHRLRLGLHALLAVEHGHGTVQHAQGALHLDREVDVAGGVDDVDLVVLPEAGHRGGRDGDAALLLLLHPVGGRRAVVGLAQLVVDTRVEQDALGGGGLAGIDVGHDADVADLVQVGQHVLCHGVSLGRSGRVGVSRDGGGRRAPRRRAPAARTALTRSGPTGSPAVVGEGLVGLGHLVGVLAALHGAAQAVRGVQDLVHQTLGHGLLPAGLREADQPAQGERRGAARLDLDGHLVGGAADAAGLDLEGRLDVVHGLLERGHGIGAVLGAGALERAVHDALGGGLLAVDQHLVDQLRDQGRAVDGIDDEGALGGRTLTRHYFFSFLAP